VGGGGGGVGGFRRKEKESMTEPPAAPPPRPRGGPFAGFSQRKIFKTAICLPAMNNLLREN